MSAGIWCKHMLHASLDQDPVYLFKAKMEKGWELTNKNIFTANSYNFLVLSTLSALSEAQLSNSLH